MVRGQATKAWAVAGGLAYLFFSGAAPEAMTHYQEVLGGTMIMGSEDPTGDGAGVKGIALIARRPRPSC